VIVAPAKPVVVEGRWRSGGRDGTEQRNTEKHGNHQIRLSEVLSWRGNASILTFIDR